MKQTDEGNIFKAKTDYEFAGRADKLALIIGSAPYFKILANVLKIARRRILIVGWGFDDRIRLVREGEDKSDTTLGDFLADLAREKPNLIIQLAIWHSPKIFSPDQYVSKKFQEKSDALPNLHLDLVASKSAFSSRHEKYLIIDDSLAFLGGIDLTHNRWDTLLHKAQNQHRVNPDGKSFPPYHDEQVVMTGAIVEELFRVAARDFKIQGDWNPENNDLWPENLPVDVSDAKVMISLTCSEIEKPEARVDQIFKIYEKLIEQSSECVYIENQYFSSDNLTRAIARKLQQKDGPEVIVVLSRDLPDLLGRLTMGVDSSMQLAYLKEKDQFERLACFNPLSHDAKEVSCKVHSKLMIVDGRYLTVGSANINERSLSFDEEINITFDAFTSTDKNSVKRVEERVLAQLVNLTPTDWANLVKQCNGSRLRALRHCAEDFAGLAENKEFLDPHSLTHEVINILDMKGPPTQEEVLRRLIAENPVAIISRTHKALTVFLFIFAIMLGAYFLTGSDFDLGSSLAGIRQLHDAESAFVASIAVTIVAFATLAFSIIVPIIFCSAVLGFAAGCVYSFAGLLLFATVFYLVGRICQSKGISLEGYKSVKSLKMQLHKIRHYGVWAVLVARLVPTGPFFLVNLVTGLLKFNFLRFIFGTIMGIMPAVLAFSYFGHIIREVYLTPGFAGISLAAGFVLIYYYLVKWLLSLETRIMKNAEREKAT